ncbi:MAG TPA: hypothetical protein VFE34_02455 [Dongiaceae bacterium]|jgi:hypothetical protein|nr:hypothetical protein [Dongiaceae bacterium]
MRKLFQRAAILAVSALAIIGCAQQATEGAKLPSGHKLQITQKVWGEYQEYVKHGRELGPKRQGAFGVAVAGEMGLVGLPSYVYCPRTYDGCWPGGTNPTTDILAACRRENVDCIIFARNEDIQVPYEIID